MITSLFIWHVQSSPRQLPCGKRTGWASSMHPVNVSVAYRGQQSFSPEACMCGVCSVFFGGWFGTEPRTPLVKHISQMCHKRSWAWTLQRASVSALEQPLMRRWHSSLLLFWGCHWDVRRVIFFIRGNDRIEASPSASSPPCQIAVKIWRFTGAGIEMSKQKTMVLI